MSKKSIERLSEEEHAQLTELVSKGKAAAYKIKHAHVLPQVDADGPDKPPRPFRVHREPCSRSANALWSRGL
ncbi:MAG: hypothetical protein, partial [Olavius algarvensis Gamma 1 endosymbiont]